MENPSRLQDEPQKKGPLDSMSRDELVKKCKGLLGLAQKAKQAKDEYAEDNKKLKDELSNYETRRDADKKSLIAMKEIVDALTESKLTLTTTVADQKRERDNLQAELEKCAQVSIENEAFKRQLKRLGDENEELLADLDAMEKKLEQVNKFGIQQQKDLVLLEKETVKWKNLEQTVNQLQEQLDQSKQENENLSIKYTALEKKTNATESQPEEIQSLQATIESSQALIASLEKEKSELAEQLLSNENKKDTDETYEKTIHLQASEIEQLKKTTEKHTARIQLFKTKIVEFSMKLKKLKKTREILIETIQEYAQCVPKWQKEILNASNQISSQLLAVEAERRKLSNEVASLRLQVEDLKAEKEDEKGFCLTEEHIQELTEYCDRAHLQFQEIEEELKGKSAENAELQAEVFALSERLKKSNFESDEKSKDIQGLHSDVSALTDKLNRTLGHTAEDSNLSDELKQKLHQAQLELGETVNELETLRQNLSEMTIKREKLLEESKEKSNQIRQLSEEFNVLRIKHEELASENEARNEAIEADKTSRSENVKSLEEEVAQKVSQLKNLEQEKNNLLTSLDEKNGQLEQLQSALSSRESENIDLLSEMRELNEAFKGRGDVISRQQDKLKDLETDVRKNTEKLTKIEANLSEKDQLIVDKETRISTMHKEILLAKDEVASLSQQAKENEKLVKSLSEELLMMREKFHETQSDAISTSTISRVDESARLQEIDESFEEKYNKLRALAVKLKKKVQEQTMHITSLESENRRTADEKNETTSKLKVKNLQALQNENDKLLDEVEKLKSENENYEKQIKALEVEVTDQKSTLSADKSSKSKFDTTVKEYQNQIKSLKQEKDSFNMIRKEIEKERDLLKTELARKSDELQTTKDQCDILKADVEKKKSAEKQSSVLNLEIDAYEKSLNDVTQKLEKNKSLVKQLRDEIESKEATTRSLNAQIKLLEENIDSEKNHSIELKQQIDIQHAKYKETEHEKVELRTSIQDKTREYETLKMEVDELQLQLSTIASDREKLCISLQNEKDQMLRQVFSLEETLEETKTKLKSTEHELDDIRAEYASYKVKAQSILRQNQTKESSRERELEEELIANQKATDTVTAKLKTASEQLDNHEKKIDELQQDNERIQKRCKELIPLLEESRLQNEQLLDDNRKQSNEYQESLKAHRLQIDTLNNCYKQQIEELERKHQTDVEELRKRSINKHGNENKLTSRIGPFGGPPKPVNDEQKIDLILMEREDAEGSETNSSTTAKRKISSSRSKRELIPLDELLNSPMTEETQLDEVETRSISPTLELQTTKGRLAVQESRVKHLTALLAENEQDLAKLTQLNDLLKEEVRRQERSMEREQHVHNSEYLKNVVLKFLTLSSGDERTRLVPVLNTILKLSPDETQALQTVAKGGEAVNRTWGSYLPVWSNHQ